MVRVKLEDVCIKASSNLMQKDIIDNIGQYPIYGASGKIRNIDFYQQKSEYIAIVKDGASVGKTMLLPPQSSVIGTMLYLLPKDNIIADFLYYIINYMHLEKYASGAAIPHIYFRDFRNEEFNLPSIDDQKLIVKKLNNIRKIIESRSHQLDSLSDLIKSRFVEMFGNQENNSKGWKQEKLSKLLLIERGGSPRPIGSFITDSEDGVNWIKIGDTEPGSIYITKTKQKILKDGTKKSRYVVPGDFLLSNSMSFGKPYILKIDGYIHDGWLVLRDIHGIFNRLYLYYALSSDNAYSQFCKVAAGAVVNNLNKEIVGNLVVAVPPIELQEKFALFASQIDKSKFAIQKAIEKDQMLYDKLMQDYFG